MGQYLKFRTNDKCAYPEREDCNIGEKTLSRDRDAETGIVTIKILEYSRCIHMKFVSVGNWKCDYKKETIK